MFSCVSNAHHHYNVVWPLLSITMKMMVIMTRCKMNQDTDHEITIFFEGSYMQNVQFVLRDIALER